MAEVDEDGLLTVGWISRAHGLRGEVILRLTSNRPERVEVGAVLQSGRGPLTEGRRPLRCIAQSTSFFDLNEVSPGKDGSEWDAMVAAKRGRWTATAKLADYRAKGFATDTRKICLML